MALLIYKNLHAKNGQERLSERQPWIVDFVFGLLHGFSFACALASYAIGITASFWLFVGLF